MERSNKEAAIDKQVRWCDEDRTTAVGGAKIEEYLNVNFESSSVTTNQFLAFAKDYKVALQQRLPMGLYISTCSIGHFYVSGFITETQCKDCKPGEIRDCDMMVNKIVDKCKGPCYIYFSCSDVRFFKNAWYHNILIRSAKDGKDFTGGANGFTTLEDFGKNIDRMMKNLKKRREVNS
jgi:hypothetical protein